MWLPGTLFGAVGGPEPRRSGVGDANGGGMHEADRGLRDLMSGTDLEATLQPLERATMLPPAAFLEGNVLDWELENIFMGGWICVGHLSAVAEPGAYIARELAGRSFFVVGGEDGAPRALHNVCRPRGARLMGDAEGRVRRRIQCPYHAWSYDLAGNLRAAPHVDGVEGFDTSCYGLREIRTAVIGGLVLVDFSGEAAAPEDHVGELLSHLEHYSNAALARAG